MGLIADLMAKAKEDDREEALSKGKDMTTNPTKKGYRKGCFGGREYEFKKNRTD